MTALFLSPHNDDEALFGAYTLLREAPDVHVVVVLKSMVQESRGTGITHWMREQETNAALVQLGGGRINWKQWSGACNDQDPDWNVVRAAVLSLAWTPLFDGGHYDRVYAPAPYEEGGHPHHDMIGQIALDVFRDEAEVTLYHSYRNGRGREEGTPVPVEDPDWIRRKLLALACYGSQIRLENTGHHFAQALKEWYV